MSERRYLVLSPAQVKHFEKAGGAPIVDVVRDHVGKGVEVWLQALNLNDGAKMLGRT